jgi:flagellar biosynthesis protein FlhF
MPAAGKPFFYMKSFFADSVQSAMEHARVELGPDALLLNSREAPPEARHLGDYEVVFAAGSEPSAPPASPASPAPRPAGGLDALWRQVEEIRERLGRITPPAAVQRGHAEALAQALVEAGVEPALARETAEAARQRAARRSVPRIGSPRRAGGCEASNPLLTAAEEISASFAVAPEIGRVTALVGPPGCGKTTTLVKLAVTQGLARGRAVRLISADAHRIGGAEQLRTYAAILGAPFEAVESAAALAQAIQSAPSSALVLIDTPGYSAAMLRDLGGDLAAFLSRRQDIDTHLVLTASMRLEDLYNTARLYDSFRPAKLLFTRVDETSSLAAVFCLAARRNMPVSFLSAGQSIPEDLEPAAKERIVDSLVRQLPSPREAVA